MKQLARTGYTMLTDKTPYMQIVSKRIGEINHSLDMEIGEYALSDAEDHLNAVHLFEDLHREHFKQWCRRESVVVNLINKYGPGPLMRERHTVEYIIFLTITARYGANDTTYFEPAGMPLVDHTQRCATRDICQLLFQLLPLEDVIALSKTCHAWKRAFRSMMENNARALYMTRFYQRPPRLVPKAPVTWRHLLLFQLAFARSDAVHSKLAKRRPKRNVPKEIAKRSFFTKRCQLPCLPIVFDKHVSVEAAQKAWALLNQ